MASFEEIKNTRIDKLQILRNSGIEPYPAKSIRTHSITEALKDFDNFSADKKEITLAGRIMAIRPQGALIFANLFDGTGTIQIFLKQGEKITDQNFKLFNDAIDIGDFIDATGILFITKKGEKTLAVSDWRILTKSLRPLPEKWHGLQDGEEKLRKRYLDILTRPELREVLVKKAKFWDVTREFLKSRGFLEVETPTLELTTGGAEARPFKTHHHDFDLDVYLRISVGELWQKRLMSAGFDKTFEIGRVYRNEGTSPEHVQEFTNMEFYWAYADYKDGMRLVRELYQTLGKEVFGTTKFNIRGHEIDLANDWPEIDYTDEIKRQTGLDISKASDDEIKTKLDDLKVKYEGKNRERLIDTIWKYCRKNISGPVFLINHPILIAPLAKINNQNGQSQMFQPIIAGSEVGRGYSELNDPIDQSRRFDIQQGLIDSGDEEAMMPDHEFVEMLEYGMPPTCGFGFGERLFAFMANMPLREVQIFPLMRPKLTDGNDQ